MLDIQQQANELFSMFSIFKLFPEVVFTEKNKSHFMQEEEKSWKNIFKIYNIL